MLGEAQLEDLKRRQGVTEQSLAAAEGRELQTAENLAKALDDLSIKTQENEILQERYVPHLCLPLRVDVHEPVTVCESHDAGRSAVGMEDTFPPSARRQHECLFAIKPCQRADHDGSFAELS